MFGFEGNNVAGVGRGWAAIKPPIIAQNLKALVLMPKYRLQIWGWGPLENTASKRHGTIIQRLCFSLTIIFMHRVSFECRSVDYYQELKLESCSPVRPLLMREQGELGPQHAILLILLLLILLLLLLFLLIILLQTLLFLIIFFLLLFLVLIIF